jgi:hypothetical protein
MRDLVVREALEAMARDAAKRFRELVAAGEEIPYDVREPGDGSPLPQYTPLTERFVAEHAPLLRELDSFGAACAAIESAELAGGYLEEAGVRPPPDPRRRAEVAGIAFLSRLWADSTDFSLDSERLRAAITELEANGDASEAELDVVVPLRGLRMPATRLELATATIVRADSVDVPPEARASEGSAVAGWEPTYLAATRITAGEGDDTEEGGPDAGTRAVEAFRGLISTLHLFKEGGVALGPHAWTRLGSGRWRRIATGAGRPRPGGYHLAEEELPTLAAFSHALFNRTGAFGRLASTPDGGPGALARAISRFEAGLERHAVLEALNDYLLALRFVLEGGGPADLGLPMRVAALCAEPDERGEVKAVVERALALERELWSGEPAASRAGTTPADAAAGLEDLARAIFKDAACGHLGGELRATADEILLADGLAVGDGSGEQRGETAEWELSMEEVVEEIDAEPEAEPDEHVPAEAPSAQHPVDEPAEEETLAQSELWLDALEEDADPGSDREGVQVIRAPWRINVERTAEPEEEKVIAQAQHQTVDAERPTRVLPAVEREAETHDEREPLAEASGVRRLLDLHAAEREATQARVANLFPQPETTEWNVREIAYDRTRRANVEAHAS